MQRAYLYDGLHLIHSGTSSPFWDIPVALDFVQHN